MTDIQLKKHFKKLVIVLILATMSMLVLAMYVLGNTKAELSIYTSAESENKLQALGINEEEFKQYLSIASYMVEDASNEKMLKMASDFIDTLCSAYEAEVAEDGTKSYEKEIVNQVLKEMTGNYIKEDIDKSEYYIYNGQANVYTKMKDFEEKPCCVEIEDISKSDNKIEVCYKLAIFNQEQMAEYATTQEVLTETKKVKAVIICNTDYQYSKYFVSQIEVEN